MKLNKSKNKGKVHPSPSSLSSNPNPNDTVSTLNKLLPAAILTLISILSLQDQEVLAYMITHSLSSSSPFFTSSSSSSSRKNKKVTPDNNNNSGKKLPHKVPCFDCGCFDCYTSYWFRWDSSPHRELIHQAIEAFEEHLAASEQQVTPKSTRKNTQKLKKSDASCSLFTPEVVTMSVIDRVEEDSAEIVVTENGESSSVKGGGDDVEVEEERESGVQKKQVQQQQQQHKGLARKVLPDVIGLFNSRLWNLWGPNV